jgi:uncharacterized protein (TIGR03083 family)
VETGEYLRSVEANGRLLASAAVGILDVPVPSTPGWAVEDVVGHVGAVHRRVADRVRRGSTTADDVALVNVPAGDRVVPWFEEGVAALVEVLAAADPDSRVWNWTESGPHTAAFWPRRMAHETAVHRVDVQLARGVVDLIDAALAADGVDEYFEVSLPLDVESFPGNGEAVVICAVDVPTEWTVTALPGRAAIGRGASARPATTLSGRASDILLVLWRRLGIDAVEVSGDRALAERFVAAVDLT